MTSVPSAEPVTVSIHRVVSPDRVPEVTAWVQAGVRLANRWDGFLGSGWIRASEGSADWYMLYRFADAARLEAWEQSQERAQWLAQGRGLVEEQRVERRTGIEGWFDSPVRQDQPAGPPLLPAPPPWKQAVAIWLGFFPVNLAFTALFGWLVPASHDWNVVLRVLVSTLVLTPIMAFWVLPWVTGRLKPWLHAPRALRGPRGRS
ncbi:antibiotic biosynthesis monooxygenase [Xylanimonas oleitrophica]|uniref:Antibiotic biosynthesis monooxygenase n=1 Tax=Xylanimonas oleitrophica TaxID=2607479 RepID=A0A2W5WU72_9MICO|nr:antibiotic biosynthesis monooxygenase [Xylanimonas oleitrophica]PZR51786.1 antibiotic biosynthesis monooxygenase [Xylanimonas oleitrophica]